MRNKIPYKDKKTWHEKIPSSRWWTKFELNSERIKKTVHMAIHTIFENQLPDEQLVTLCEINWSVYTEEAREVFKESLTKILSLKKEKNLYNRKCYKHLKT